MLILHLSGPTTSTTDRRAWNHRATASDREHCALPRRAHCRRGRRRPRTRTRTRPRLACRDELNKNRSSRKTDFQEGKRSSGSPILLKILSENRFSGKTYCYTIASRLQWALRGLLRVGREEGWGDDSRKYRVTHLAADNLCWHQNKSCALV